jgi:hypothetical protein
VARQPIWHFAQKIAAISVDVSDGSPVAISYKRAPTAMFASAFPRLSSRAKCFSSVPLLHPINGAMCLCGVPLDAANRTKSRSAGVGW